MLFPYLSPDLCGRLARDQFGNPNANRNKQTKTLDKEICESLIGTTYVVASELWNMIDPVAKLANGDKTFSGAHPKHLFWGLLFLKNYCTEPVMVRVVGHVDPKTLRKWVWIFVNEIAGLRPQVVSNVCVFCNFIFTLLNLLIDIDCRLSSSDVMRIGMKCDSVLSLLTESTAPSRKYGLSMKKYSPRS